MIDWQPGKARTLTAEQLKEWTGRTDRADTTAKTYHPQWERALERYAKPKVTAKPTSVNALLDYRHVEGKKSQLFHRTPDVQLTPVDPQDDAIPYTQILPLRQKFLNYELGPKGAKAKRALHKTLIDTLAASGWMICKVGFEQVTIDVEVDAPVMFGSVPGQTQKQKVKVPVWSRRFISAVSSKKLLVPDDFRDTDFDAAPWLGIKGTMLASQARKLGWTIPADFVGSAQSDESVYHKDATGTADGSDPQLEYIELWLKASLFDPTVSNPELYRCLVLVKGLEAPAWYVDSPYQTLTNTGQLSDDSLIGNPIHVGTIRDLIDSAYVPSDLVVGEQLSEEVNQFRTDMIRNRHSRRPRILTGNLTPETLQKVIKNEGPINLDAGQLEGGVDKVVAVVGMGSEPRDNYAGQDMVERDYEQALGMSANQQGQFAKGKRTATEVRAVQGNSSARAETEKDRVREYFVDLVRKFDTIVQRTATSQELTKVLGQQGAALWEQWRVLPGRYAYDILPDSGRYIDAQQYQSSVIDLYNLVRKDERVNTEEILTMLARAFNRDPAKFIAPPKEKAPEPIKLALSFKGEDVLNPAAGRLLLDLLTESGVKLSTEAIQMLATVHQAMPMAPVAVGGSASTVATGNPHGGSATRTEPVNQHQTERTGGITGVGNAA